ncbi:MAG: polyphenol oxidase family protein, partial [Syntrophomonadaceae bacterium]|nr:polyphenol oxidase family protein [Syntrophomonadaceae bacterium]
IVRQAFAWSEKVVYPEAENQYYWDLPLTNELILRDAGVPKDNITSCRICTACNQKLFFSYRGAGGRTGRMGAVLGLLD